MNHTVWSAESYVGRNSDRDRVYVSARITHHGASGGQKDTDHRSVEGNYLRLSITGEVKPYRSAYVMSAGQVINDLADVVDPAPGWTLDDLFQLLDIWRHWHLNDMQAGCSAMPRFIPQHDYVTNTDNWADRPSCPMRDYRWGDAWLVKQLPDEIIGRIVAMFDRKREV